MKANLIPFSSIVGGGVLLTDDTGMVIGQLALLNFMPTLEGEQRRAEYLALCEELVRMINAEQVSDQLKHYKSDTVYDVLDRKALMQISTPAADIDSGFSKSMRTIADGDFLTIYRNPDGMHFVRFPDEVVEPRFQKV